MNIATPVAPVAATSALPSLRELVPHEPPMLLLDNLLAHDANTAVCEVQIQAQSPFLEEGSGAGAPQVPAVVGLEYMAQCVAVFAGLSARRENRPPTLGFLVGCRELRLATEGFAIGDRLVVEARWIWGESVLGSFACTVRREGELLAEGTLTVYRGDLPEDSGT
jgi:predicted hotdog family 3-hydroxylacyl-ACP dehydratase